MENEEEEFKHSEDIEAKQVAKSAKKPSSSSKVNSTMNSY
jgi:hypothetical protein